MKLFFLLFLIFSCNSKEEIGNDLLVLEKSDPEFNQLKEDFEKEAYLRYLDISVKEVKIGFAKSSVFKNSHHSGIALCQRNLKQILVNKDLWDNFSETKKEIIIFHELGHCSLDKDHNNHEHHGEKTSIMNERVLNPNTYADYKKEYLDELFLGHSNLADLL